MKSRPNIFILADFSIFSGGIKCILEKAGFHLLGEARHWENLFDALIKVTPDIIILNLIPYPDICKEQLRKIRNNYPDIPLLVIVKEGYADFFKEFILLGIKGFLFNNATPGELIKAVIQITMGKEYFPPGILNLVKETLNMNNTHAQAVDYPNLLTSREITICKLFCKGLTYKEIGAELYISPRTVESHKKNILFKLKIKTTADIVKYALQNHLI
jgi:DNA-binding NarL/FixJ family response regulator